MIRFQAFKKGRQLESMALSGAYLFAQDEIPVRSQISFTEGEIIGLRHSDTAVGLVTLWEVDGVGKVLLQTTRLPERNEPYNLNVELARGRLLRLTQKREEWQLAEFDDAEAATCQNMIEAAMERFVHALVHLDDPPKAASLADESLELSLKAGETMAAAHARMYLERRTSKRGLKRHSMGCVLDPTRLGDADYLKFISDNFSLVTVPLGWKQLEPREQGQHDFELLDRCVNWLYKQRIAVKVGPLLSFAAPSAPNWLYIYENDFEHIRDMAYEFITAVVTHCGHKVQVWDVVSGLNVDNCFKFAFDQIIEMTRSAALAAKHASRRSLALIEISQPWGEYYAINQRTIPPLIYADMVAQSGVNFDGFSIRLGTGRGAAGMQARDMLEMSSMLDRFSMCGKSIHLTGVQAPSTADARDNAGQIGEAGYWRQPWDPQTQAQWLDQTYRIAFSKPYVETVVWQDVADRGDEGVLQCGGLLTRQLQPKPAFANIQELGKALKKSSKSKSKSKSASE